MSTPKNKAPTPVEQAIEALDKMSRMLFSYHSGVPVKVEDLQSEVKAALASLKSVEPRLTVAEVMRIHGECVEGNSIGDLQYIRYNKFREALTKTANP